MDSNWRAERRKLALLADDQRIRNRRRHSRQRYPEQPASRDQYIRAVRLPISRRAAALHCPPPKCLLVRRSLSRWHWLFQFRFVRDRHQARHRPYS